MDIQVYLNNNLQAKLIKKLQKEILDLKKDNQALKEILKNTE